MWNLWICKGLLTMPTVANKHFGKHSPVRSCWFSSLYSIKKLLYKIHSETLVPLSLLYVAELHSGTLSKTRLRHKCCFSETKAILMNICFVGVTESRGVFRTSWTSLMELFCENSLIVNVRLGFKYTSWA